MKLFKTTLISIIAMTALVVSTASFAKKPSERFTIYDLAQFVENGSGELSVLNLALSLHPGIETVLDGNGQFTVFAPTDLAFADLAETIAAEPYCYGSVVELALAESDYIRDVLLYHVARGNMDSTEVLPKDRIRMLSGEFITRMPPLDDSNLVIKDNLGRSSTIEGPDNYADNGVVHLVSAVVLPYLPPPSAGGCDI